MIITLAMAWFLSYADRVNMSVASIPMQAEFGWDETTKGVVMGSVFLGYIGSQLLGGIWVTRGCRQCRSGVACRKVWSRIS